MSENENNIDLNNINNQLEKKINGYEEEGRKEEKEQLRNIFRLAYKYIQERAQIVGTEIKEINFDGLDLDYVPDGGHVYENTIRVSKSIEGVLHEFLHLLTERVSQYPRRILKGGFHSSWRSNTAEKDEKDRLVDNFRGLNEAVTQKIAGELSGEHGMTFFDDYKNNFNVQNEQEKFLTLRTKIKELELHKLGKEHDKYLKTYGNLIEDKSISKYIEEQEKLINLRFERRKKTDGLDGYSIFNDSSKKYVGEVKLLNTILDKLAALSSQNNKIDVVSARAIEWQKLQKAYFENNVFYLRKIERAVGQGFLRRFNDINPMEVTNGKIDHDYHNIELEKVRKKIDSM